MLLLDDPRDTHTTPPGSPGAVRPPVVVLGTARVTRLIDLSRSLRGEGFDVWPAESGLEALSVFFDRTGEIDAFVLDADLPDLPGLAFLRRLRAHFPAVPCVFLAGPCHPAAAELAAAGADVVSPTASVRDIAERVREVVAFEMLTE
jgi:two-component system, OmpR family, response regulator